MSITFQKDTLFVDDFILSGESLWSQNNAYQAKFQIDGNFVLYKMLPTQTAIWATNLYNPSWSGNMRLTLQPSGILEGFNQTTKASVLQYNMLLSTSSQQMEGLPPYHLVLTNSGVLGLYDSVNNKIWQGLWTSQSSNTNMNSEQTQKGMDILTDMDTVEEKEEMLTIGKVQSIMKENNQEIMNFLVLQMKGMVNKKE